MTQFDLTETIVRPVRSRGDLIAMLNGIMVIQTQLASLRSTLEGWIEESAPSASDILFEALKPPTVEQQAGWAR